MLGAEDTELKAVCHSIPNLRGRDLECLAVVALSGNRVGAAAPNAALSASGSCICQMSVEWHKAQPGERQEVSGPGVGGGPATAHVKVLCSSVVGQWVTLCRLCRSLAMAPCDAEV